MIALPFQLNTETQLSLTLNISHGEMTLQIATSFRAIRIDYNFWDLASNINQSHLLEYVSTLSDGVTAAKSHTKYAELSSFVAKLFPASFKNPQTAFTFEVSGSLQNCSARMPKQKWQ